MKFKIILNVAFIIFITRTTSLSAVDVSDGVPYNSPLAPFPSQDQTKHSSYINAGNLENPWLRQQSDIKGSRAQSNLQSGYDTVYPSLNNLQHWNQTHGNHYDSSSRGSFPTRTSYYNDQNSSWNNSYNSQIGYDSYGDRWNLTQPWNQDSYSQYGYHWNQTQPWNQTAFDQYRNRWNQTHPLNQDQYDQFGNRWNQTHPWNQNPYDQNRNLWNGTKPWSQASYDQYGNRWNQTQPWNQGQYDQRGNHWNQSQPRNQALYDQYGNRWNQTYPSNQGSYDQYGNRWNQTQLWNQSPNDQFSNRWNQTQPWNQGTYNHNGNPWNQTLSWNQGSYNQYGNSYNQTYPWNQGPYDQFGNRRNQTQSWNQGLNNQYDNRWNQTYPYDQYGINYNQTQYWNQPNYRAPDSGNLGIKTVYHGSSGNTWENRNSAYTNYPNLWNQTHPNINSRFSSDASKNSQELLHCLSLCSTVTKDYAPVCGTDLKTYPNMREIECAQRCGVDVRFAYNGSC